MAIDAVHGPHLAPWKCTSICRLAFVAENLYLSTVEVGVTHPRNLLSAVVGSDVVDAHPGIDMPVDPLDQPERLLGRAYFQVQAYSPRSIVLVGEVVGSLLESLAVKFLWPVTLFADGPCRAEILDRCRDRPGIDVGSGCIDLVESGKLGSDVPVGPGSDMAGGAGDLGVGRVAMRHVLGFHHRMAKRAAEPGRLGVVKCLVAADSGEKNEYAGADHEDKKSMPVPRFLQIYTGPARLMAAPFPSFPPCLPGACRPG